MLSCGELASGQHKIMSDRLGRGLNSLIPPKVNKIKVRASDDSAVVDVVPEDEKDKILKIKPTEIKVNPMQPRQQFSDFNMEELEESIKEYGIIQPLIVSKDNGEYELIAGERRLRAAVKIGLKEVPAIIRDANRQKKLEIALVENLQREDLNSIETAMAYRKLIDEFNLSQEEVAKRVGRARSSVANTIRILNLPDEIQAALIAGKISEGHAKYLLGIDSKDRQWVLFKKIIKNGLTVNDVSREARRMGGTKQSRIKINYRDKDKEFALREFFGTRAEIKRSKRGGQIIINFYSDEELEEMINKIKRE